MNKQTIRKIISAAAIVLFGAMTAVVGYNYASMECAAAHLGASAPPSVALLAGIPFIFLIAVCLIINIILKEKK